MAQQPQSVSIQRIGFFVLTCFTICALFWWRATPARSLATDAEITFVPGAPDVRVALQKDLTTVTVFAVAGAKVLGNNCQELSRIPAGGSLQVYALSAGLGLADGQNAGASVRIESLSCEPLRIDNHPCATRLRLLKVQASQSITVVAELNLEEYLTGVLAGEVPYEKWHTEALKAQAIVSRSYAYFQLKKNAAEPYDVESTVMSQVFRADRRDSPILRNAVNATRGLILTFAGTPFSAYFHSTCGGHTESSTGIFPDHSAIKPLSGVPCPYCTQSPNYRWHCTLDKSALGDKLKSQSAQNMSIGKILTVEFLDSTGASANEHSLRANLVRIRHAHGVLEMQGNAFRLMAGPRDLKSLYVETISDRGSTLDIAGKGFGHGVGLCQYGSQGMASAGYAYPHILGYYYPGAALTKLY